MAVISVWGGAGGSSGLHTYRSSGIQGAGLWKF